MLSYRVQACRRNVSSCEVNEILCFVRNIACEMCLKSCIFCQKLKKKKISRISRVFANKNILNWDQTTKKCYISTYNIYTNTETTDYKKLQLLALTHCIVVNRKLIDNSLSVKCVWPHEEVCEPLRRLSVLGMGRKADKTEVLSLRDLLLEHGLQVGVVGALPEPATTTGG